MSRPVAPRGAQREHSIRSILESFSLIRAFPDTLCLCYYPQTTDRNANGERWVLAAVLVLRAGRGMWQNKAGEEGQWNEGEYHEWGCG